MRVLSALSVAWSAHVALGAKDPLPNCAGTTQTAWVKYVCGITQRGTVKPVDTKCFPRSYSSDTAVKGAVLLFHGYTACPDSLDGVATKLASEGFHVYAFLTRGHGRALRNCAGTGVDCVNNTAVDELPTTSNEYAAFVKDSTSIFSTEVVRRGLSRANHAVGVAGLSLGGALAANALVQDSGTVFNTGLLVNPFLGITVPPLDDSVASCVGTSMPLNTTTFDTCLRSLVGKLLSSFAGQNAANTPTLPASPAFTALSTVLARALSTYLPDPTQIRGGYATLQSIARFALVQLVHTPGLVQRLNLTAALETPISWGANCYTQTANGRGGYCDFRLKHLLAVHAIGEHTAANASLIKTPLASVLVERDGYTRNGLAAKVVRTPLLVSNRAAAMCVYRRVATCDETNTCGAPHSIFSRSESLPVGPMYWEADLFTQVAAHMKRGSAGSTPNQLGAVLLSAQDEAAITASQGSTATPAPAIVNISKFCTRVPDPRNPSAALFGTVPVTGVLTLALTAAPANLTVLVRTMMTDATTDSLYLRTLLEQVAVGVLKGATVRFDLPSAAAATTLETKIKTTGLLTGTAGVRVVSFQRDGGSLTVPPTTGRLLRI
jgi:pimeloyl-ACP methyl ester carboxylesterase